MKGRSFATRLTLALGLLLLAWGGLVALLAQRLAHEHEQEALQRLSHGLARHIVGHWPEITNPDRESADRAARAALLSMLMTVNPGVQAYVLDADGRVAHYIGEPGMVRQHQVDLDAVRAFLAGASLPLRGTDPMGSGQPRIFSAAMFPPRPGDARPPGYLYLVLDSAARAPLVSPAAQARVWRGAALAAAIGLLLTALLGWRVFSRMSRPLMRLSAALRAPAAGEAAAPMLPLARGGGAEVQAIAGAIDSQAARLQEQAARAEAQHRAHRETIAGVAHDLRTPLTALHGLLESLAASSGPAPGLAQRTLAAALAQSDRLRRLSQQLFELAALQSTDQVLHRESVCLDELVTDTVQKFEFTGRRRAVQLSGLPPGRIELQGDLELIERALSNLIDNALQHAPTAEPVRVSLQHEGALARIVVEDTGPGLPPALAERLERGESVRDPSLRRASGGIGGLGLAIAQRIAQLHGGSLVPLPAPQGRPVGTRLCLALPLAP
jgi:signal transduction histidine kinase